MALPNGCARQFDRTSDVAVCASSQSAFGGVSARALMRLLVSGPRANDAQG